MSRFDISDSGEEPRLEIVGGRLECRHADQIDHLIGIVVEMVKIALAIDIRARQVFVIFRGDTDRLTLG